MRIEKNVAYTQAKNCWLCIHVGTKAYYIGRPTKGMMRRIEVATPFRWFRITWKMVGVVKIARPGEFVGAAKEESTQEVSNDQP
jgi:hypothetical protein